MHSRASIAVLASAAANLGLALALAGAEGGADPSAAPAPSRVPLQVVELPPPPPPPPVEQPPSAEVSAPRIAPSALPPIELPPVGAGDLAGLSVPRADESLYRFELPLGVPAYAREARGERLEAAEGAEPPRLLHPPDLARHYPLAAKRLGVTGRTVLRLDIDARGSVQGLEVLKSEPAGVFERAAEGAAKRLRYRPAIAGGRPRGAKVRVELVWHLEE